MTLETDVARRVQLESQKARIDEELSLINERLRQQPVGKYDAGDWTLVVSPNRTFKKEEFEQRFPVAQYPHFFKPTINLDAVKENFSPVELKAWYADGTPKTAVK